MAQYKFNVDFVHPNVVVKLSRCRMSPKNVIKISDDLGKHMGDNEEFEFAKHQLHLNF